MSGDLIISIARELEYYLRQHPEEIPEGIEVKSLRVLSEGISIPDIEMYTSVPYDNTFGWRFRFDNGADPDKSYLYKIHYRAYFQGESGIVSAQLFNFEH